MNESRRTRIDVRLLAFSLALTNCSAALLSAGAYITNTFFQMGKADQCAPFLGAGIVTILVLAVFLLAAQAWSFRIERPTVKATSLIATVVGAVLFASGSLAHGLDSTALFAASGAAMALGYATQFIAWGKAFARIPLRDSAMHIGIAAALSALVALTLFATTSTAAMIAAMSLLPIASALLAPNDAKPTLQNDVAGRSTSPTGKPQFNATRSEEGAKSSSLILPELWPLLAGIFVCIAVMTFMWKEPADAAELQFASIITQGTFFGFIACALAWSAVVYMHPDDNYVRHAAMRFCPVFAALPIVPCLIPLTPEGAIGFGMGAATGIGFAFFATLPLSLLCKESNSSSLHNSHTIWPSAFLSATLGAAAGFAAAPLFTNEQSGFIATALFVVYLVVLAAAPKKRGELCERDESSPLQNADPIGNRCALIADEYRLTPRESDVLSYLARGRSATYAAKSMFVSTETVKVHIKHIYEKLGIHSRQELLDLVQGDQPKA